MYSKSLVVILLLFFLHVLKGFFGAGALELSLNDGTSSGTRINYRQKRFANYSVPIDRQISLVFIFDDSKSMSNDLQGLREGAKGIITKFEGRAENPIFNYVLVRFNERANDAFHTTDSKKILSVLDEIKVGKELYNPDCEENTYKGILNGIDASLPRSRIFVFTDAHAKNLHLRDKMLKNANEKGISINFVLSGKGCDTDGFQDFNNIARETGGEVFNIDKRNVKDVVGSIAETLNTNSVTLESKYYKGPGIHIFEIVIDGSIRKVVTSVAGKDASVKFTDPNGTIRTDVENILKITSTVMDKITDPWPGVWLIATNSSSAHYINIIGISDMQVLAGLSHISAEKISDTTPVPIKGIPNHLSVFTWRNQRIYNFTQAELVILTNEGDISKANYSLSKIDRDKSDDDRLTFISEAFIPPSETMKIYVKGFDLDGNPVKYLVIVIAEALPGDDKKPNVTISSRDVKAIEGGRLELVCNVNSTTKPIKNWYFEDTILEDAEFRSVIQKSEGVNLEWSKIGPKESGTYRCQAKNAYGEQSDKIDIFVEEIPWKIQIKEPIMNATENQKKIEIKCQVTPKERPVKIKWIYNGKSIVDSDDLIKISGNTLLLETVDRRHAGNYTCEGFFRDASKSSSGNLTVYFPPKIHGPDNEEHTVELDEKIILECSAEGNPMPNISWFREDGTASNAIIEKFSPANDGVHVCIASNQVGSAQKRIYLKTKLVPVHIEIKKPPVVTENDENITMVCSASPKIKKKKKESITWKVNGKILYNSDEYTISGKKLIIKKVNRTHIGEYTCILEFQGKRMSSNTYLDVRYGPEMIGPTNETHRIEFGDRVNLNCRAVGNPEPNITWSRKDGSKSSAIIEKFSSNDYGKHVCNASNGIGKAVLKSVFLIGESNGPPNLITSADINETIIATLGENVTLPCRCERCGSITFSEWTRTGIDLFRNKIVGARRRLDEPTKNYNFDLNLIKVTSADTGLYECFVENKHGHDRKHIRINVGEKPWIEKIEVQGASLTKDHDVFKIQHGKDVRITCVAKGSPETKVQWYKNGTLLPSKDYFLQLGKVSENDSGTYQCNATNMLGSIAKEIKLIPFGHVTHTITITEEGNDVSLHCENQKWYFNEEFLNISSHRYTHYDNTLTFTAEYQDSGIYRCDIPEAPETVLIVQAAPTITPNEDETIRAREGQETILKCRSQGNPLPEINWIFNQEIHQNDTTYELLLGGDLKIKKIGKSNTGHYTCRASNKIGIVEKGVNVILMVPPRITSKFVPSLYIDPRAANSSLNCSADGKPEPIVSWLMNGEIYTEDRKGYNILSIGPHLNSGNYTCVAKNIADCDRSSIIVESEGFPTLSEGYHPTIRYLYEGDTLQLSCPVRNASSLRVYWYKEDENVCDTSGESLTKVNVKRDEAAAYKCRAENAYGEVSFTHKVHIFPSENPYSACKHIFVRDEQQNFTQACTRYKSNHAEPKETTMRCLTNLTLNDTGLYKCNVSGAVELVYLVVKSAPQLQMNEQNYISVKNGDPLELECRIAGIPAPIITWRNNNETTGMNHTLIINDVRSSDAGVHKCCGENEKGIGQLVYHVDVQQAPQIVIKRKFVTTKHRAVAVKCIASGNPPPFIVLSYQGEKIFDTRKIPKWSKTLGKKQTFYLNDHGEITVALEPTGATVIQTKNTIRLLAETKKAGRYKCSALNALGSQEAEIKLKSAVNIKRLDNLQRSTHSILAGLPLYLKCPWTRNKPGITKLEWLQNGNKLNDNHSHDGGIFSIPACTPKSGGNYTCEVTDTFGSIAKKEFQVQVLSTSFYNFPSNSKLPTLYCPVSESPSDTVSWDQLIINHDKNTTRTAFWNLTALTMDNSHAQTVYTCFHKNSEKKTKKLEVTVRLVFSSAYSESHRTVEIGHEVRMHCPVRMHASIKWTKGNQTISTSKEIKLSPDKTMLVILSVAQEDEGIYICESDSVRRIVLRTKKSTPEWSEWGPWTSCSKTCDTGTKTRKRQCILPNGIFINATYCSGNETERQICNDIPCPINGEWSEWSNFSECSATCGRAWKQRTRRCDNPSPSFGGKLCLGLETNTQECNLERCYYLHPA